MITAKCDNFETIHVYGLTQYDYGQLLHITGVTVPDKTEIHFYQRGKAITQYVQSNQVLIPDHMLQYSESIKAYLYKSDKEIGETIKRIVLHIFPRKKPGDYVTPDEPAYSRLLPLDGKDGQFLGVINGEYIWVDIDAEFATEEELRSVEGQIPDPLTNLELEQILT